jgi:hypothetical protein
VRKIYTTAQTRPSPRRLARRKADQPTTRRRRAPSHNPALHVLLSKTVEFLLGAGESPEHVTLELEGQAERVKGRLPLWRSKDAKHVVESRERFWEVGGVIHDWHREAAYTNSDGEPRQLTLRSLRTLVGRRFPKHKVSATVRWMFEHEVVRRTNSGKIAPTGGRAVIPKEASALDRAAASVPQYLRTELRNASTQDQYFRDINRAARVFFLPEKFVPLWRSVARERAQAFLEGVDNWLEDHERRDDTGPVREVAMHCFAYTGDARLPKASRTHPRQLKARR